MIVGSIDQFMHVFQVFDFGYWVTLAILGAAILIQIGANLAHDVFDLLRGADTAERLGPARVTEQGLLKPEQVKRGMYLVFALAIPNLSADLLRIEAEEQFPEENGISPPLNDQNRWHLGYSAPIYL